MTADELRAKGADFRAQSATASERHGNLAYAMVAETGARHAALGIEANVADCMARQFRRWAEAFETAAAELDEP